MYFILNFLKNLKIGAKIFFGYFLLMMVIVSFPIAGWVIFQEMEEKASKTILEESEMLSLALQMKVDVVQVQQWLTDISATRGQNGLDDGFEKARASQNSFLNNTKRMKEVYLQNNDSVKVEEINQLNDSFDAFYKEGVQMAKVYVANGTGPGNAYMARFDKFAEDMTHRVETFVDEHKTRNTRGLGSIVKSMRAFRFEMVAAGLIALAFSVVASFLITRSITHPLVRVVGMIRGLNSGNLADRLKMSGRDEIGQIGRALDDFADNLQHEIVAAFEKLSQGDLTFEASGVIREGLKETNSHLNLLMMELRGISEKLTHDSMSIYGLSQSISSGAESQAASLEEISASMADISSQTKRNADSAKEASGLVREAMQEAQAGNNRMTEMIMAMNDIQKSANEIQSIIKVIDEIAFQTNLLALNAAVESGRAGIHGKGFAVVADEVRGLAARSADAAKETAELIENAMDKVRHGSQTAQRTSEVLNRIVEEVTRSFDLMSAIATSSTEQANAIMQMTNALGQIEHVTQANTRNAQEWIHSFEDIAAQLSVMGEKLDRFKLRSSVGVATPMGKPSSSGQQNMGLEKRRPAQLQGSRQELMAPDSQVEVDENKFGEF